MTVPVPGTVTVTAIYTSPGSAGGMAGGRQGTPPPAQQTGRPDLLQAGPGVAHDQRGRLGRA